jgi:hypothetical protein
VVQAGSDSSDLCASLAMLELDDKAERDGDWYKRKAPDPQSVCLKQTLKRLENQMSKEQLTDFLGSIKTAIATTHRGISKRLIQHYLAAWGFRGEAGSLLKACLDFGQIRPERLRDYVSPALVKLFPIPALAEC